MLFENIPPECLIKLVSIVTDGTMLGKHNGVITLIMKDDNYPEIFPVHCVIHCELLIAKYLKYTHVL